MIQYVRSLRNVIPGDASQGPGRRPLLGALFVAGTLLLAACGSGGDDDDTTLFELSTPATASVTADDTTDVTVNVERDDDFDDVIEITLESLPTGVTADPMTIGEGETSGVVTLEATPDAAAVEDDVVTVVGTSGDEEESTTFTLDVEAAAEPDPVEAGDPDPEFGPEGAEGRMTYTFDGVDAEVHDIELLADGSMIVAGSMREGADPLLVVARIGADGELAGDFGEDDPQPGYTTIDLAGTVQALDLALDSEANVVKVAAVTAVDGTRTLELEHLAFGADDADDGTVDAGASNDEVIQTAIDAAHGVDEVAEAFYDAYDVDFIDEGTTDADSGDIVVAGTVDVPGVDEDGVTEVEGDGITEFGVLRFDEDGTLDTTFSDTDGVLGIGFAGGNEVALGVEVLGAEEDYGMIVFGTRESAETPSVAVLVSEGGAHVLDEEGMETFGGPDDEVDLPFEDASDAVVVTDAGGASHVIVGGTTTDGEGALARFDAAGVLDDADFGDAGIAVDAFGGTGGITELALQGDTVVAAGTTETEGATNMTLARYDVTTGDVDEAFGTSGYALSAFDARDEATIEAIAANDDRIVLGGSVTNDAGDQEGALAAFVY